MVKLGDFIERYVWCFVYPMLQCICSVHTVIDHRRCKNVLRRSVTHSAIS